MKLNRIDKVWNSANPLFRWRFGLLSSRNFATMATWRNDFSSLLSLLHKTRVAMWFPSKKPRVAFGLPYLLIELFYICIPAAGRAAGRTVTWLWCSAGRERAPLWGSSQHEKATELLKTKLRYASSLGCYDISNFRCLCVFSRTTLRLIVYSKGIESKGPVWGINSHSYWTILSNSHLECVKVSRCNVHIPW